MLRIQRLSLDFFVLFLLLLWALIGPSLFDDGWFIQTAQHSLEYRNFYNIYNIYDGRFPLGWIWFFLNSAWVTVSDNLFWNRLPSVFYLFISWKLIFKSLALLFSINLRHAILGSLIFLTCCFGFLLSVRPESFVFLCLALIIFLLVGINSNNIEFRLIIVSIVAGVSASTHLSGAIALFPIVFWLTLNLKKFKTVQTWSKLFTFGFSLVCAFGSTFVLNLLLFSNLRDFVSTTELWNNASESSDQSIFLNLFNRFFEVFNENAADSHFRRSSAILAISVFLFFNRGKTELKSLSWIYWSLISALAYLLFLPSASPWQLGSLMIFPIFLILGTLISAEKSFSYLFVFFSICCLSIFNWIVWLSPNNDLFVFVDYLDVPGVIRSSTGNILFWFAFLTFLTFLYIVLATRLSEERRRLVVCFSSTLFIVSFLLPIVFNIVVHLPTSKGKEGGSIIDLSLSLHRNEPICADDSVYYFPDILNGVVDKFDSNDSVVNYDGLSFNQREVPSTDLMPVESEGFLSTEIPPEFRYVLLFAKSIVDEDFSLTASNGDLSSVIDFQGRNAKREDEYSPRLIDLSGLRPPGESNVTIEIRTIHPGISVSNPIFVREQNVQFFAKSSELVFQVSSELQPYFSCLEEEFFVDGVSVKPDYMIGGLPLFPRSPASVFFDYEDYVVFPIDIARNISGYALVES